MKVLVVGGSGYLGQFVVDHLLNAGHPVLFTHSKPGVPMDMSQASCLGGATILRVDLSSDDGLQQLDERADQMGCGVSTLAAQTFHTAGFFSLRSLSINNNHTPPFDMCLLQ
jgi:nucleoside-diphosphate-sugar epimerase